MAETASNKIKSGYLTVTISGKLMVIEQIQGRDRVFYVNRVIIPSIDEYSKPTEVPVYSETRFANEGEIISDLRCCLQFSKRPGKNGGWFDNITVWAVNDR